LNFVAVIEQDTWTTESWTEPGNVADLRNAFQDWHPQVRGILERVPETFRWALFGRSPMAHWSDGRVTLLGDACHAMLPFMAQGAAQSIEDGATLAGLLSRIDSDSVPDALLEYESIRLPRVTRVHGLSEANKRRLHLPDGTAQRERDAEMAEGATDFSFSAVDWLYRYDAEQLHQT
jgi:salicylate hydroxylase